MNLPSSASILSVFVLGYLVVDVESELFDLQGRSGGIPYLGAAAGGWSLKDYQYGGVEGGADPLGEGGGAGGLGGELVSAPGVWRDADGAEVSFGHGVYRIARGGSYGVLRRWR